MGKIVPIYSMKYSNKNESMLLYNTIIGISNTMEFSLNGGAYIGYIDNSPPNLAGDKTVKARMAAVTGVSYASNPTILTFTDDDKPEVTLVEYTPAGGGSIKVQPIGDVYEITVPRGDISELRAFHFFLQCVLILLHLVMPALIRMKQ